ncbi:hypothetical protein NUP72_001703 [Salmonella enterica]|nr:hypothetical protein [Salmonella enterica]
MEINSVYLKQNENESIYKLMAIRRLYSNAKFVNKINFIFSVIIPVLISLAKIFASKYEFINNKQFIPYLGYYGIAVLLFTIITGGMVTELKKKAAKIQEMFDCYVLSIKWNDVKVGKKISSLDIHKSSRHFRKKNMKAMFENWYFKEVYAFDKNVAALLCQNENIGWDLSQRIVLNRVLLSILSFSALLLIGYGFYCDMKLSEFLFYIVFLLPLFRHFYLQLKDNKSTIERCIRVNEIIEKNLDAYFSEKKEDNRNVEYVIRAIQDEIYSHRISNQPVPDIIHKCFRSKNEEQFKQHFDYYLEKLK